MPRFYLLKITLLNMPHPIWRQFVVPSNISLSKLHEVIQVVMGWHNCHMHSFLLGKQQYMSKMAIDCDPFGDNDSLPEEKYTLESLLSKKGAKIGYWYDFGDDWMHEIVVGNADYTNSEVKSPICCIEGVGACPPEDCGGPYGFFSFCEAMADPKHPEHGELKEWFGGKFDPKHFDIDAVNRRLGVGRSSAPVTKKTAKKAAKKAVKKAAKKKATKKSKKKAWVFVGKR
jgi:hypothetical protein